MSAWEPWCSRRQASARYCAGDVEDKVSPVYTLGSAPGDGRCDRCRTMTTRLILAAAVVMAFAAATAYATVHVIPPDHYPPTCEPDGLALQGDAADDEMDGDASARPVSRRARDGHDPRSWRV